MSTFQPQQQQQPAVVYPNPVAKQPSHHSNGSFATVFIVLAVIAVVSAVACFLGRLCTRRLIRGQAKPSNKQHSRPNKDHHNRQARVHELAAGARPHPPKEHQGDVESGAGAADRPQPLPPHRPAPSKEGDIEFGFDMMMRSSSKSSSAPNGNKPDNNNNSMRSGSRGHVAFERNADHAKHHGGGARDQQRHDYYGGPRASE